jgi:hypothetical protein
MDKRTILGIAVAGGLGYYLMKGGKLSSFLSDAGGAGAPVNPSAPGDADQLARVYAAIQLAKQDMASGRSIDEVKQDLQAAEDLIWEPTNKVVQIRGSNEFMKAVQALRTAQAQAEKYTPPTSPPGGGSGGGIGQTLNNLSTPAKLGIAAGAAGLLGLLLLRR